MLVWELIFHVPSSGDPLLKKFCMLQEDLQVYLFQTGLIHTKGLSLYWSLDFVGLEKKWIFTGLSVCLSVPNN